MYIMCSCSNVWYYCDSLTTQQLPGFVKFLTVADIPPGGTNCFISERDIPEEVL